VAGLRQSVPTWAADLVRARTGTVNTPMVTEGLDVEKLRQIAEIIEPEQAREMSPAERA